MPGEAGVWVFIFGDMLIFALLFNVYVFYRAQDVELYRQSQMALDPAHGAVYTFLLLISSWFVVIAVRAARRGIDGMAPRLFAWALLCGVAFVVLKFFEYRGKVVSGITPTTNDFYMYYFILTGIHLLHVLIGIGVLAFMWRRLRARPSGPQDMVLIESGACYWHMVDLLWVVLFALLYLMS